jgi:hypothetical protein
MSSSKNASLGSVTGREEFIIGEALATALIALEQLPKVRQPTRNMADMKMLLNSLYSPPEVSLHLTTARWRFIPSARPVEKGELIYENVDTAPIVYFDIAPAHGVIGGAVQIELAVRILNAVSDGSVETKFITSGRLRCSPTAALNLRNAIDASLRMILEQPQQAPAATAKLN